MSESLKPRWSTYHATVASGVVRVDDEVREPDRDRFAFLNGAEVARRDVGGDLDDASVAVEEAESVTAAGSVDLARFVDDLHLLARQVDSEGVHVLHGGGAERYEVETLVVGSAQPQDVLLGRTLGGQKVDTGVGLGVRQSPTDRGRT